jgi:hypothetical protein
VNERFKVSLKLRYRTFNVRQRQRTDGSVNETSHRLPSRTRLSRAKKSEAVHKTFRNSQYYRGLISFLSILIGSSYEWPTLDPPVELQ